MASNSGGKIKFHYLNTSFNFPNRQGLKAFLARLFHKENMNLDTIDFIFCDDAYLLQLNQQHLKHNTYTDIITFPLSPAGQPLVAEIYISIERVKENAIKFGLYDTTGEISIRIKATSQDGTLLLSVENPFDPSTSTPRHGTGFGLSSIQRRLYLLFGRNDLLTTKQNGNVFISEVRIPQPL